MLSGIAIALVALFVQVTVAVDPIHVNGSDFVNSVTGERFQIVGVAYQPGGSSGFGPTSDPLSDPSTCLRDAALMQQLGVNAIRVYSVNTNLNHDVCASIFNAVGIYMLIDVNSPLPGQSIDRSAPYTTYNMAYLNRTFGVVEAFKDYPNTLVFFAGNEVIDDVTTGKANPPYIRAVTRDLKNYIAKNSARSIPVGYSAADVRSILVDTYNYLQCTTTPESPTTDPSRSDIFALNSYSWCGDATFVTSGYNVLTSFFQDTSVPVFFSEYGCNTVQPRLFSEVDAIYGPQMAPILSGGLVFEYVQGSNNYGLVTLNSNGSAQLMDGYDTLQQRYKSLDFKTLQASKPLNTSNVPPTCSSSLITVDGFANDFTLPAVPAGVQALIDNGIPNPMNGQIVSVPQNAVSQIVQGSSGKIIQGLAINPLPSGDSNMPGGGASSTAGAKTTSARAYSTGATATSIPTGTQSSATGSASASATADVGVVVGAQTWFGALMGLMAIMGAL